jgi:hypothetical protein
MIVPMDQSRERRRGARRPLRGDVTGNILKSQGEVERPFHGTIQDISEMGLCVLALHPAPASRLIQCRVELPDVSCSIPTLAEVRWAKSSEEGVRMGLMFLL